ncbi:GNAT family N-acetyltransferase [Paenibacillus filicis]
MNKAQETSTQSQDQLVVQKQGNSFVLQDMNGKAGEITYRLVDVDTWVIDRTYVDPAYRGGSVGRRLVDLVVREAREQGKTIIPACSYALAVFQQDPGYADVWNREKKGSDYSDSYSSGSATSSEA